MTEALFRNKKCAVRRSSGEVGHGSLLKKEVGCSRCRRRDPAQRYHVAADGRNRFCVLRCNSEGNGVGFC